ncbi:tetratricopeptide repeat protein [Saccharopolyspora sp. NPDC050389]|uniref:tetratricopeptide repeat protein n=1 Tax=Saccharopolyspora sp. NPDC050389 TaxID=3155516 RepID=UPI0033F883E0
MMPGSRRKTAFENKITGGVFFGTVIMGEEVSLTLAPEVPTALGGLPPARTGFTGRDVELDELVAALAAGDGPAVPAQITGLPGAGKTELAIQAAHRARAEGAFPGGVLFVDLHGYDEHQRVAPASALESLLRAVGIRTEHIPPAVEDRTRLFRDVLRAFAEQGRRLLVVADNASSAKQVEPLAPGDGSTGMVVTSRHTLDGAGPGPRMALWEIAELPEEACVELLAGELATARRNEDTRVRDHPRDARRIAELCGRLPLALQIIASLLAADPKRPLAAVATDLADERSRLDELRYDDNAVRAAFELSYRQLDTEHAALFAALPLIPGPHFSTEAAAALEEQPVRAARQRLDSLARAHLVERAELYGRWRMHDLLRLYAEELAAQAVESDVTARTRQIIAVGRVLEYYQRVVEDAMQSEEPDDEDAWFGMERPNLIVAVVSAQETDRPDLASKLAAALRHYLNRQRYFDDLAQISRIGAEAAHRLGQVTLAGILLSSLGVALRELNRIDEAVAVGEESVLLLQRVCDGDDLGEAYNSLGAALTMADRGQEALDVLRRAQHIHERTGNKGAEGQAVANLGNVLYSTCEFESAYEAYLEAGDLLWEARDYHGQATVLANVCQCLWQLDRLDDAAEAGRLGADLHEEIGNEHGAGLALASLADVLGEKGETAEAVDLYRRAIDLFQHTGDQRRLGITSARLGGLLIDEDSDAAIEPCRTAVRIFSEIFDEGETAEARLALGRALADSGHLPEGVEQLELAARGIRESGNVQLGMFAEWQLAQAYTLADRADEAAAAATQAARRAQDLGDEAAEADAWRLVARSTHQSSAEATAEAYDKAVPLLEKLGHGCELAEDYYLWGSALHELDRTADAVEKFRRAQRLLPNAETPELAAPLAFRLGAVLSAEQRHEEEVEALEQARTLFRAAGDVVAERNVCERLLIALWKVGRAEEVRHLHSEHLVLCRRTDDPLAEAGSWLCMGDLMSGAELHEEAISCYREAQLLCEGADSPWLQGLALLGIATACNGLGDHDGAVEADSRSVELLRLAENREDEGRAWWQLVRAYVATGRHSAAAEALENAIAAGRDAGLPDELLTEMREILRELTAEPEQHDE